MISGNVPNHLIVGARTGFLTALVQPNLPYQRIAETIKLDSKSATLVDLGGAPMPVQDRAAIVQSFIEKSMTVKPVDWHITVYISYNAVQDDLTGNLERRVRSAGNNFTKHLNNRVFTVLNAGDGQTYGVAYDGQDFFDSDHVDKGAAYTTNQDNEQALALSLDNFTTVNVAAQLYVDDQGEYVNYAPNLLVVPPALEYIAAQITGNPQRYDTANHAVNPYAGKFDYIVAPQLDSTAWFLLDTNEPIKPLIVVMRQEPFLQETWFDPEQRDGGYYYFKFYARYEVYYGDWRLATMGNT